MHNNDRETFLSDVIIGAVEGGTGYWASVSGYHWSDEQPSSTRATLHDSEEGTSHPVTLDTVRTGLRAIRGADFPIRADLRQDILRADRTNDAAEIDAEGADVIVQAGLFGEIIYG